MIYYSRGTLKVDLDDTRGAIADFTKTIELKPNYAEAYFNRGMNKIKLNQNDSGCLDLSKAGELGLSGVYDTIKHLCN